MVEHRAGDGGLHDAGVDGDGAVGARDVEREAAGLGALGGERGLDGVHDGLEGAERVVGVQHVEAQHDGLAVGGEGLEAAGGVGEATSGECVVGGDEDGDAGAALVGLEVVRDARGLEHGGGHVEAPRVGEDAGDVDRGAALGTGGRDVEAGGDDEAAHGEHADVVRLPGDGAEDGGVRPRERRRWRVDDNRGRAASGCGRSEVDGAEVGGRAAGGLEQRGHELPGGREAGEVGRGEVLEEDVVPENVGEVGAGGRGESGGRAGQVGVRHGQQRQRRPPGQLAGHGAGREQPQEVGEVGERREHGGHVDPRRRGRQHGGKKHKQDQRPERGA